MSSLAERASLQSSTRDPLLGLLAMEGVGEERIDDDDTPKSLELEDQDQIDCFMEMIGGGNPSYGDRW